MKKEKPYHKYVFDLKNRRFVGKFERMYKNEDRENYDSWFQEDLTHLGKQISLLILNRYNFVSILDIGCGKGSFTHLLKKANNKVTGIDISSTAIRKAKIKYRNVEFKRMSAEKALNSGKYDLIVMMEVLSYLRNWREILRKAAANTCYAYLSLFLPPHPIGFIKNFSELKEELNKYFEIETELLWNNETILILCKSKAYKTGTVNA